MAVDERVLSVIEAFYAAAMDEARWDPALQSLADLTGSQAATFWVLNPLPRPELPTFRLLNFDPTGMQYYLDHMVQLDPTNRYPVTHPHEPVVHDGQVTTEREKDRNVYYDWHLRLSDTRYRLVGHVRVGDPSTQAGVALHRTTKAGRFDPSDIERFTFLPGHSSSHTSRAASRRPKPTSGSARAGNNNGWQSIPGFANMSIVRFVAPKPAPATTWFFPDN